MKGRVSASLADDHTIVLRFEPSGCVVDELIGFPFGLEANAARKLVRDGTLRAARIGRRWYAKRSDVLALVDRLAPTPSLARTAESYADVVALAGRRERKR